MIVIEDKLTQIFSYIPKMRHISGDGLFDVTFSYGDKKALNAFLKNVKNGASPYPLIWLLYPYKEKHLTNKVNVEKMELILAVQTNSSMTSEQRIKETYSKVLNPLFDYVINAFRLSSNVNNSEEVEVIKFPNYSDDQSTGDTSAGSFKWDAIKLTLDITITNKCFKPIKL